MSLIVPPFQFAHCTDSLDGTTPATPPGINFTAAANNADGTAVTLLSALAHDVHYFVVSICGIASASVAAFALADILIDPAGGTSWVSWIDDLVVGFSQVPAATNGVAPQAPYQFPIWIPAGASVGLRCRTSHTANITTGRAIAYAFGNPNRPEQFWCGQKVETLGVTPASSSATSITPGNSGTWGSWTDIGSPSTARYGALQVGTNGTSSTQGTRINHLQVGYGSTRVPGSPTFLEMTNTSESIARGPGFGMPIFCDIPAGTQMQVRATANTTAEATSAAVYGVY